MSQGDESGLLVFISHNHADKPEAAPIAMYLVAEGMSVFYDDWNVRPGESVVGKISAALESCTHMLVLWSRNASASSWVGTEVETALESAITAGRPLVIPVLLDDTPLPALLKRVKYVRLAEDRSDARADIIGAVTGDAPERSLVQVLVDLFNEVIYDSSDRAFVFCPKCGSDSLTVRHEVDGDSEHDITGYYEYTRCNDCGYEDMTDCH